MPSRLTGGVELSADKFARAVRIYSEREAARQLKLKKIPTIAEMLANVTEPKAVTYPSPTFIGFLSAQYTLRGLWASYFRESLGGTVYLAIDFVHLGDNPRFTVRFNPDGTGRPKSLAQLFEVFKQKKSPREVYTSKLRARAFKGNINVGDDIGSQYVSLEHEIAAQYRSTSIDYKSKGIRLIDRMRGKPSAYKHPDAKRLLWVNKQIVLPTHTPITIITNSFDVIHS